MKSQASLWPVLTAITGLWMALVTGPVVSGQEQELSRLESRFVKMLETETEKCSRYLEKDNFDQALKFYERAAGLLKGIQAETLSATLVETIRPRLDALTAARERLVGQGLEPMELPAFSAPGSAVGFAAVSEILVARCGNCHVRNSRGQFSMATYRALLDSGKVIPKDPVQSRIIQMMETGEMPPNGNRVPEAEFETIRAWVAAGAGPEGDENANLAGANAPAGNGGAAAIENVVMATGTETVSFSSDIAPILGEKCLGCHVEADRPRGGLNMTMITGILRGGDRGGAIVPGKGAESLLVMKLKGMGDGQRMPQGAAPLDGDTIAKIEKWIDEGATFDGDDPATPMRRLSAIAKTKDMDSDTLAKLRQAMALEKWRLVFPGDQPVIVEQDDFQLVSSLAEPVRNQLLAKIGPIFESMRKDLGVSPDVPLLRGKVTIFAVSRQYDFGEFSRMVLGRESAQGTVSMWSADAVDAWLTVLVSDAVSDENVEASLTHDLGAIHFSSLTKSVPRWFADSMGYIMATRLLPKSGAIDRLKRASSDVAAKLGELAEIRNPRTNETTASLGGFFVFGQMINTSAVLARLQKRMAESEDFESAIAATFGATIEQILPAKNANNDNRRNR